MRSILLRINILCFGQRGHYARAKYYRPNSPGYPLADGFPSRRRPTTRITRTQSDISEPQSGSHTTVHWTRWIRRYAFINSLQQSECGHRIFSSRAQKEGKGRISARPNGHSLSRIPHCSRPFFKRKLLGTQADQKSSLKDLNSNHSR